MHRKFDRIGLRIAHDVDHEHGFHVGPGVLADAQHVITGRDIGGRGEQQVLRDDITGAPIARGISVVVDLRPAPAVLIPQLRRPMKLFRRGLIDLEAQVNNVLLSGLNGSICADNSYTPFCQRAGVVATSQGGCV